MNINSIQLTKIRKIDLASVQFKKDLLNRSMKRKAKGRSKCGYEPCLEDLRDFLLGIGFTKYDLDIYKKFESYAVSNYPGPNGIFKNFKEYKQTLMWPEEWFSKKEENQGLSNEQIENYLYQNLQR